MAKANSDGSKTREAKYINCFKKQVFLIEFLKASNKLKNLMLQMKPTVWTVSRMSPSRRDPSTIILYCQSFKAVCSREKKCRVLWRCVYKEILNGTEFPFQLETGSPHTSVLSSSFLSTVLLRGKVMSACSLGLRSAHNKLETLTAPRVKRFQMLEQTAEERTDGSPPAPLIFKKTVFQKIIFNFQALSKSIGITFPNITQMFVSMQNWLFLTKLLKNFLNKIINFGSAS